MKKTTEKFDPEQATPEEYLSHLQKSCSMISLRALKRMASLHASEEFLEKSVESHFGDLASKKQLRQVRQAMKLQMREIESSKTPTIYQEKIFYSLINDYSKRLIELAELHGFVLNQKVVLGTLPTGQVNARAIWVPSGGIIIAFNYGLFLFIHLMAKATTQFFVKKAGENGKLAFSLSDEDITASLDSNKEGHVRFVEVLFAYLVLGSPSFARQYFQKGFGYSMLTTILRDSAEFFVLAHEYAHIFIHDEHDKAIVQSKLLDEVPIEEISRNLGTVLI
jgi:hypothetical protein